MSLATWDRPCFGCPFTASSIVSPERREDIEKECRRKDSHFICHKQSTMPEVIPKHTTMVCTGYLNSMYRTEGIGQGIRIWERLTRKELPIVDIKPEQEARARKELTPWSKQR